MAQRKASGATKAAAAATQAVKKVPVTKAAAKKTAVAKKAASKRTDPKPASAKKTSAKPAASASSGQGAANKAAATKARGKAPAAAKSAAVQPVAVQPVSSRRTAQNFPREPRIDAYIAAAAPFAQPILRHLRECVHAACPQVEEAIKWGMPSFVYRGKLMCGMAAFKQHASLGFWQGANIVGAEQSAGSEAMGQFGRIAALADLPGKRELAAMLKQAMALIESGVKRPSTKTAQPKPPPRPPADLAAALAANPAARATFDAFPPSQQREYVEWVETAKREETRSARVAQAVEWMAQGKVRNWKYMAK